jgi:hypothetical protein
MYNHSGHQTDTDHYLVVAKVWERLAVNKQRSQRHPMKRFNLKNFSKVDSKEQYRVNVCCVHNAKTYLMCYVPACTVHIEHFHPWLCMSEFRVIEENLCPM